MRATIIYALLGGVQVAPFGRLRGTVEWAARKLAGGSVDSSSPFANCTDSNEECHPWAKSGECANNPRFMLENCRASCRMCQSERCHDSSEGCARWATSGECGRNHAFMLKDCPFSCDVCDVNFKEECRRDPTMEAAAVPGTIDATMRRALDAFQHLRPRVLHVCCRLFIPIPLRSHLWLSLAVCAGLLTQRSADRDPPLQREPWILSFDNFLSSWEV